MAPRSMMPSMPRLRTPARSLINSPRVASRSGVEMRSTAAKKPISKTWSRRSNIADDPQPVRREEADGDHAHQRRPLDHVGEVDRHAEAPRHRAGAVEDDGEKQGGRNRAERVELGERGDDDAGIAVAGG